MLVVRACTRLTSVTLRGNGSGGSFLKVGSTHTGAVGESGRDWREGERQREEKVIRKGGGEIRR